MPVRAGAVAYIDDCDGKYQFMASVVSKEAPVKGRKPREPFGKAAMLWGDVVFVHAITGADADVSAKGHRLKVPTARLTDQPLLNLWQIDVGQGDASLIRFPDGKWAAIDLGPGRSGQISTNSGRTAVDFMAWMAFEDHVWMFQGPGNEAKTFHFDWIAFTHPDQDHIGAGKQFVDKLGEYWSVGTVYHNGMGRFNGAAKMWTANSPGLSQLGQVDGDDGDELYLSSLLDGFSDVDAYEDPSPTRTWKLAGNWAEILKILRDNQGGRIGSLKRLSDKTGGGEALAAAPVSVKILGPVEDTVPGTARPGLRYLDNNTLTGFYNLAEPSLSRNGQSLVLRIDYGDVRILMTGDLNFRSQALLLQRWPDHEFSCHVGKACHHGSDDISWNFLKAMAPIATLFSSGDQETHVHPRALVLGMTGAFAPRLKWNRPQADGTVKTVTQSFAGHSEPELFAPLLYSTELSRSVAMNSGYKAFTRAANPAGELVPTQVGNCWLAKEAAGPFVSLADTRIVEKLTYGLINVRTDGKTVAIAVLEESARNPRFHVETFRPSELEPI